MAETDPGQTVVRLRAKEVFKEAVQYTGNNLRFLQEWSENHVLLDGTDVSVITHDGRFRGLPIDWWVVRGVLNEYYPVHPRVKELTYDEVRPEDT